MILGGLVSSFSLTANKISVAVDNTVDSVNWTNVDSLTTVGTTNVQQISGISGSVDLEVSWTGSLGYFYISVNDLNGYGGTVTLLSTSPTVINVTNNKYVSFKLESVGLQNNLNRSVTVKNASDSNLTLDTFTIDVDGSTTKSTNYDFNVFWDTEMLVDRYDTTITETTAKGWFFR